MLISSAPLRISFLGGGSDYAESIKNQAGFVFGCAINLYVHVMSLPLPPFAEEQIRFTYRKTESVDTFDEIAHPVVREMLKKHNWVTPINLATMADVAGNSGLGSSSSFTVALESLLNSAINQDTNKLDLAINAIELERNVLQEAGGFQDQYFAAFGGLRGLEFKQSGGIALPSVSSENKIRLLESYMLLIPFGGPRQSSVFALNHINKLEDPTTVKNIEYSVKLAKDVYESFSSSDSPEESLEHLADALRIGWNLKIANANAALNAANQFITDAVSIGALAGKLCGAGSSGFIFLLCEPELKKQIISKLQIKYFYQPRIDQEGVKVVQVGKTADYSENNWNSSVLTRNSKIT